MTASASERITEAVASQAGVTAGTGRRGEWSFKIGQREIGHLHGGSRRAFLVPEAGVAGAGGAGSDHHDPVFPGRVDLAARKIENDAGMRDVIELMRRLYDRLIPGTPVAEHAASKT